jgi:hypothetical protein
MTRSSSCSLRAAGFDPRRRRLYARRHVLVRRFNVRRPRPRGTRLAEQISNAVGRKIRYVDLPPADLKKAMLAAGVPEWSANALLDLQRLYREGGASLVDPTIEQNHRTEGDQL